MIPIQLTLQNFFSYHHATLDFRGLHTACICGENGAGKSSLLEAIAWSVWGKSRAASEDDAIRVGEKEVRVDFVFQCQEQVFRIVRRKRRGQSSVLEFQVETPNGFRSITAKGLRATQQKILDTIKLDYDTFVCSAYLRQGRADEFMVKKPTERKQVLANLLKLDRYDVLADKSKDIAKQAKTQADVLEQSLVQLRTQLHADEVLAKDLAETEAEIATLQQEQEDATQQHQQLQVQQTQRQTWQQQLDWYRQQYDRVHQELQRLQDSRSRLQGRQEELQQRLDRSSEIRDGYDRYCQLQAEDDGYTEKFARDRDANQRRTKIRQELDRAISDLQQQQQQIETRLSGLEQQERELQQTLKREAEIEAGVVELTQARAQLSELERKHAQASPLMQRRLQLQVELDRVRARLESQLEQWQRQQETLTQRQRTRPELEQALQEVGEQIEILEKKRVYQHRVEEKGRERRSFLDRLEAHQRDYEARLQEIDRKIELLQDPEATCPLCDRSLDEHHWELVSQKHRKEHEETLHQLWVVKEQIAISQREIAILRQEYRDLKQELTSYDALRERRGQLQAKLSASEDEWETLQRAIAEREAILETLAEDNYGAEERSEIESVDRALADLNYNDKELALARNAVDRLRWVDIQQAQLQQARRQLQRLEDRRPEYQEQLTSIDRELATLRTDSDGARQLADLDRYIANVNYDLDAHNAVRSQLRQSQGGLSEMEALKTAEAEMPRLQQQIAELDTNSADRSQELANLEQQGREMRTRLDATPDLSADLDRLQGDIQQRRSTLNDRLARLGRLQQQKQHLDSVREQIDRTHEQLEAIRRRHWVYKELSQAFGKNGIQALTIETVLPQLEAETNRLLSRLSANQLHVQFVTQKATKGSKKSSKLIETLEIFIADSRGTRPYETYSGGEAFRIDFAIRLALSKLLAQRSGAALQMLVVDEGFGTQDDRGCERLISAIEAIAPDFACILAVTHIPRLKEAFETRIEVQKTDAGSEVRVSV
ncbi:MAG: AAA family ATPase [Cyanobacteria bacterium SID2]|nr:AAA family ATPase [Cyanobacteria bacterium SID2]MBP0005411.1 AAA family ATPase [Cyanobacteria bacterium SBC]